MSDLLQQLSSFLNLPKLVAVTVPGMIATLALMLFFNPPACKQDSESCWYCQGQDNKEGVSKPKAGAAARPQGTYLVSKLAWEQANQSYKTVSKFVTTNLTACAQLPEYIVSSSRLKSDKDAVKNLGDLLPIDPAALLQDLDFCSSALTDAQTELNIKEAAKSNVITTLNASISKLNNSLADARAALNSALERSLTAQVNEARTSLEKETTLDSDLKSALTAAGSLLTQVSESRKGLLSDASTAVPAETKSTWQTAAQALGSSVLLFLLVSIVVGQLFDPIHRMIISSDPIRGLSFPFLNILYTTDSVIGTVRFGDQRYESTRREDVKPLLKREPNLLEPEYAIGRGLLTQAEYSALQDRYYSQYQILTGLMLPLFLLALVIYIRLLCCGTVEFGHGGVWVCALLTLTLLFSLLSFVSRHFVSEEERKRAQAAKREEICKKLQGLKRELQSLEEKLRPLGEQQKLLEQELNCLEGERTQAEQSKCEEQRKRIEERRKRVEQELRRLAAKIECLRDELDTREDECQRLEARLRLEDDESKDQESREKTRRLKTYMLGGITSVFAVVVVIYALLSAPSSSIASWYAVLTLVLLVILAFVGACYKVWELMRFEGQRKLFEQQRRLMRERCEHLEEGRRLYEEQRKRLRERREHLEEGRTLSKEELKGLDEESKRLEEELKGLVEDSKRLEEQRKRFEEESKERLAATIFAAIPSIALIVVVVLACLIRPLLGSWWLVGIGVGLPTLEVLCFVAGIDRLHNFYSNVQARIVGAVMKQQESQTQKFAELLTDPNAKLSFIDELKKRRQEINDILGPLTGEKP